MKAWMLKSRAASPDALFQVEGHKPVPAPGEVLIRVRACSLNYRDQLVAKSASLEGVIDHDIVPLSDGAGEIEAVGPDVTRYAVGDRVAGTFHRNWIAGPIRSDIGPALGGACGRGMLAEYVTLPEDGIVPIAASLSFEEAATLPCAGVTAWNALMEGSQPAAAGDHVLVLGTGGVSLLALQIAKAAGAAVIVTSSSDAKLERAARLGADHLINYRAAPDWGAEAARLSGKPGVERVLEVGGAGTLDQSLRAVGYGQEIALIGGLQREGSPAPRALIPKGASMRGIFVGSAAMARRLHAFIDDHGIKPVIDRSFAFDDARAAYAYQTTTHLFGKVVITI